ncbi:glycine--tRNA ligase subunit beta [Prochlorococcus marinus]|uniref:glycine--tRNA ligase subunit beta n=1 Tax=Prochlorococcus marinus TaxID=1219 RepID=UPI001ADCD246|nr:glycine--tRNA ligase subunit beta [Prochlorococcus marinus]MBO8218957.1 glycine--tRNA ligase subunit beta [Prochlorococcus marinus CUG1416]MBW3051353.1 glycine--tRNA ligase subunit beta [Prochlorococcus marinus str. MU1416]
MSKYLLEIGTEELPANFSHSVLEQFKSLIEFELDKKLIKFNNIVVTSTPRRIVLLLEGLVDYAEDKTIIRKGPKASSAFLNGSPTNAALGFANSLGIDVVELEVKNTEKGDFVFGKKIEKGQSTRISLSSIIPKVVKSLQGPRFMKWGAGDIKFSRPIRWITSIYNDDILDFAFDGCDPNIQISNKSKSHRLINEDFEVKNPDKFFELLKQNRVLVNRHERKERIESLINEASNLLNLKPDLSKGLLNELTDLVEWPDLIIGKFSEEFLDLPVEVLSTVMKSHQRYVPLLLKNNTFSKLDLSSEKNISTNFFVISNGLEESNNNITRGNEKVLRARFSDAKFFVESDKKVASIERNEKLKSVSYLKGLGNIFQRVERIEEVTKKILIFLNDKSLEDKKIIEAARYCKNDLCSEIVFEFPELQGIMGGKYLKDEGFSDDICLAVAEHYLPSFYKDALPSSKYGAIVSIADKIETLISIFISGKRPSGSSDPYALRRNLNGVIKIIWDYELDLPLDDLFNELIDFWKIAFPNLNFSKEKVFNDLNEFLVQRIVSHLEEISLSKELIKAVCSSDELYQKRILNIVDLKNRLKSIVDFKEKETFFEIQKVITRVSKLAKSSNLSTNIFSTRDYVNTKLFEKECELKVFEFIRELEKLFSKGYCNYLKLLKLFEININTIEDLFDNEKGVLVMSEDIKIRNNRLNLLSLIRNYSLKIADFTLLNS